MLTSNGYVLDESASRLGELDPVPAADRDDRDRLWDRLRRDGYLFLRGALDREVVHAFRRYYFESLAASGLTRPGTRPEEGVPADEPVDQAAFRHTLFRQVVPGPEYAAFCSQPALRDWYAWFLGGETFLHRRKIIRCLRPGDSGVGAATQAHYDLVYIREGTDRVLSSWIPLGDCPPQRGGLIYLEGSHRRFLRDERAGEHRRAAPMTADLPQVAEEQDARWLVGDYRAGDMVVHTAYTMHAGLDNVDPDRLMRLSTDIRYQRADQPIDWRWQNHWHSDDGL